MKWTLFLSRLAWILNACFVITLILRLGDISALQPDLIGTLVISGWVLAPVTNGLVFLVALIHRHHHPPILLGRYYAVYLVILILQLLFITRLI
jgi:phosphatidylserine synthase